MTLDVIDWIAATLLFLGIIKTLSFTISPKYGKKVIKYIIKEYHKFKFYMVPIGTILAIILIYIALMKISVSQLMVGGYGVLLLVVVSIFFVGDSYKKIAQEWIKKSDSWWRGVCLIFLIVLLVALYFVIF